MPPTATPRPAQVTTWDVARMPASQRRDAWVDAICETHLPWALDGRDGTLAPDAALTRRMLGSVALVDCVAGAGAGARTSRRIRAADDAFVGVLIVRDGVEHLELGERRLVARAGDVVVWDSRVPVRFRVPERLVKRTLLVPRGRLPVADRGADGCARGLLPRGPATSLLVDHLAAVVARCGPGAPLPAAAAHAAGLAAVDLLVAALAGDGRPDHDETAWTTVRDLVEDRLGDPELDPRALAAAASMSLRALYGLFERHGETVVGHVRRRRLERAHADLLRLGHRTTVAAVAARWGFGDPGTFARAYRRMFGVLPSTTLRADP